METNLREEIMRALEKRAPVRREGKGWRTRCPHPKHEDLHPSFFLYPGGGGRCFSQCNRYWSPRELSQLLGIQVPLYSPGLTVAQLAQARGLTVKYLYSIGVVDGVSGNNKRPCVDIPYLDEAGKVVAVRKRLRLDGVKRFIWRKGDHPTLYGLNKMVKIRKAGWVILVEGESDSWVLWSKGLPSLGIPGVSMWRAEYAPLLDGLTVYLWHEPDPGGDALLKSVAADLPALRVIEAPSSVKDPSDLYIQNTVHFKQTMAELIKAAQEVSEESIQLPEIMITDQRLRDIAGESWEALLKANEPPIVFQRGHTIVELLFNEDGMPFISVLDRPALRGRLDRAANFSRLTDSEIKPARPPNDVVADMLVAPHFPLPILRGISEAPMFTPPDVLVNASGYHQGSQFYMNLAKALDIPAVPDCPDATRITQARNLILEELLADFPFVDDADCANAVAVLLLPFTRLLIEGPTPLHLIESPTPGAGKGLLVDVLAIPAAGRGPATMTEGRDEDEWRKRLTAKLLSAPQFILIDNVRSRLDSAALSTSLTTGVWEDRQLGHSQTVNIPVTCTWLATANNPALSLEIARRTVSIRLDPAVARPWERDNFKHHDLRRWAKAHRSELIWAALTMVRAWTAAGKPTGGVSLGSYESWSGVIGGILKIASIPGFMENSGRVYTEADSEVLAWEEFCSVWWQEYQDKPVTVNTLFALAKGHSLLLEVWAGREEHSARTRLGLALKRMRDRVIAGCQLRVAGEDSHTKTRYYLLEPVVVPVANQVAGGAVGSGGFPHDKIIYSQNDTAEAELNNSLHGDDENKYFNGANTPRNPRMDGEKQWEIEI